MSHLPNRGVVRCISRGRADPRDEIPIRSFPPTFPNTQYYNLEKSSQTSVTTAGAVSLLAMVIFFWYRNRQAERARHRYFRKSQNMNMEAPPNGGCVSGEQLRPIYRPPPSNNNAVRQPPEYEESLMEV